MIFSDEFIRYAREWETKINAFLSIQFDDTPPPPSGEGASIPEKAAVLVKGLPFAVKDNIAVKDMPLTCGSKMLEHFRSPYSATAVQKLEEAGGVVIGKTNLDEFGMGSSTGNSAFQQTGNPWDIRKVPGGSSGGSAAAVAAGIVPYALGSDTGGSVRQPAALCGVTGLKPTYGAVSRYGLTAYASSLETIGIIADTAARCRAVFAVICGRDPLDQSSRDMPACGTPPPLFPMTANGNVPPGGLAKKIGVISAEALTEALARMGEKSGTPPGTAFDIAAKAAEPEAEVSRGFALAKERLATQGHTLVDITIPALQYAVPAYYTIASAEASSNLARFDSIRYGTRPERADNFGELIEKARTAGLGPEVKLRILLGTFALRSGFQERYYLRAQRIRAGITAAFEQLLGDSEYRQPAELDAILMPVFPLRAFDKNNPPLSAFAQKAADLYTCCANLAGLPALAFPVSAESGLPVGVQLVGRAFAEGTLLDIAETYERQYPLPPPPGYIPFWRH